MANKWLKHLAQFRQENGNIDPKNMMKAARKSYQSGGQPGVVQPGAMGQSGKDALAQQKLKGGSVVSYERATTESSPAKVGGRRSRRQSRRKSRRTRRR
jgi:hypothetical protein